MVPATGGWAFEACAGGPLLLPSDLPGGQLDLT